MRFHRFRPASCSVIKIFISFIQPLFVINVFISFVPLQFCYQHFHKFYSDSFLWEPNVVNHLSGNQLSGTICLGTICRGSVSTCSKDTIESSCVELFGVIQSCETQWMRFMTSDRRTKVG